MAFNEDPALLCAAHAAGARVVGLARFEPAELLGNASARSVWVAAQVARARELHLDGLNFDYVSGSAEAEEPRWLWACVAGRPTPTTRLPSCAPHRTACVQEEPLPPGSPLAAGYSALVAEAAAAFHAHIPGSQVSVDVPWSPHGIDSRHYDWAGLAAAADLLFIMAYDMQSQVGVVSRLIGLWYGKQGGKERMALAIVGGHQRRARQLPRSLAPPVGLPFPRPESPSIPPILRFGAPAWRAPTRPRRGSA